MELQLIRYCYGPDHVAGLLKFGDALELAVWTLECPWRDNQIFTSCVPDGTYPLVAFESPEHPDCWVVTPVPGRTGILIHVGNEVEQTQGCILIGQTQTAGKVWNSADALRMLNYKLNRNEQHVLHIGSGLGAQFVPVGNNGVPSGSEQRGIESELLERDRDSEIPPAAPVEIQVKQPES